MIWFIVTACVVDKCPIRKQQYINGINSLKQSLESVSFPYKIIIVENNGLRYIYLDELGCDILYTNNNFTQNEKGYKELNDVFDCINHYNIADEDFIVKMTGRYVLEPCSEFMNEIKNLHNTHYECIIKYGSYITPVDYKTDNCITGLIGMKCYYVKRINYPNPYECVEWKWGLATYLISDDKICKVKTLGINICPGSNTYFLC